MKKEHLLLTAAVLLMWSSCGAKKEKPEKAPTRVKTTLVSSASAGEMQTYVGIIEEREATAVSFTGMGVVKRVLVSEGQSVGRGQLLAEMDDTQARNLLSGAEATMTQATDAYTRMKMLHDSGSLPEAQWIEVQSKVAQAKSQLEVARKNLADCRLVAPVGGVIGHKMIGAGETALPSQAVVNILDVSTVKVKVAVPEDEVSGIATNTTSTIRVDAVDGTFQGGRIEKGVTADALTHTYDIRIHVANNQRKLLPGMVASVRFVASDSQQAQQLSLPVTAVQKTADGSLFVWTVVKDSTAHRTKIAIGRTTGNNVTISDGISTGQRVVTDGYQKLSEGTKVIF